MDKVINNVKELNEKYPVCTRSYQELVIWYWLTYQCKDLFLHRFFNLTSPESICRAYRTLVAKGDIQ